jgi:hypothetical protein
MDLCLKKSLFQVQLLAFASSAWFMRARARAREMLALAFEANLE